MRDYVLSCCSTADLTKEWFKERDIRYVCFNFELGGVRYKDDMGETISPEKLYQDMLDGADTKTSQVSVGEYMEHFQSILEEGKDIFHLTLSSGISGSYNSACIAKNELCEKYPDRKIYVVDSMAASSGYGLLVDTLADKKESGMKIDELYQWTQAHKLELNHWFFSTDLTFYIRGGRVSKAAGLIGTVLNICPLLNVDSEGKLVPIEKVRTKKRVIKRIVEKMQEEAENGLDYDGKCFISQSMCLDDADAVAKLVEDSFAKLNGKVQIFPIGATIGSHTGPGTVALFFWGKQRK
jgi:DegV family protein with EDD domain